MARKDDQSNAQFDTGFGSAAGGTFGGSAGAPPRSQAAMGGEFSNGFGGGTNAVSQIFRDGAMGADDKRRKVTMGILVGAAVVIIAGSVYYFMLDGGEMSTEAPTTATTPVPVSADKAKVGDAAKDKEISDALADEDSEEMDSEEDADELASAPTETTSSGTYTYNEMGGGPIVTAPEGTTIEVSRAQDFSVMYMTGTVGSSGKLRIPNPPPGKVYWRVAGKSDATEITIEPAAKLNLEMKVGATLGASETVKWDAEGDAAFYRFEMAGDAAFNNISHAFSTSKSQVTLSGVNPGTYFVRVGGLNVASGRWEYTKGSSVEVK